MAFSGGVLHDEAVAFFAAAAAAIGLALAGGAAAETGNARWRASPSGRFGRKTAARLSTARSTAGRSASCSTPVGNESRAAFRGNEAGPDPISDPAPRHQHRGRAEAEYVHIDEFRIGQGVRKNWGSAGRGEHGFDSDTAVILGDDFFQKSMSNSIWPTTR